MIMTMARQVVKPECLEEYYKLVEELVKLSNQEEGIISYQSVCSMEDKSVHMIVECFKDQAAIDAHGASEHVQRIAPKFKDLLVEEVGSRYDVMY